MILIVSEEENQVLEAIASAGLTAPTMLAYMTEVCGGFQVVVQKAIDGDETGEVIEEIPEDEGIEDARDIFRVKDEAEA